jgi:hypothetical protein
MPGWAVIGTPGHAVEQPLWSALRDAAAPASVFELHGTTGAHPNSIQHRLSRWVAAGLVARLDGSPKRYAMNDDTPRTAAPPRVDLAGRATPRVVPVRARLWRAMRVLNRHGFDVPTLMMSADASRRATEELVNVLRRAGYLRQTVRNRGAARTWSTFRLVRDTGPRPPLVQRRVTDAGVQRELVDGNSGARVDISPSAVSLRRRSSDPVADGGEG